MSHAFLSDEWIAEANAVLADHSCGLVSDFRLTAEIRLTDDPSGRRHAAILSADRLQFTVLSENDAEDAWIALPQALAHTLVLTGENGADVVNEVLATDTVSIGGDVVKLGAFAGGVLRGADPALVTQVAAL